MTAEQRLDRLERIAKLFVTAGLRMRRDMRRLDEKIGILVDAQIANEDRFAVLASSQQQTDQKVAELRIANEERFAELRTANEERFAEVRIDIDERFAEVRIDIDERFAEVRIANDERFAALAESQRHSEQKLAALIDTIQKQTNGKH
jgi:hypothetical protein